MTSNDTFYVKFFAPLIPESVGSLMRIVEQKLRAYVPGSERESRKFGGVVDTSREVVKRGGTAVSEASAPLQASAEAAQKLDNVAGKREAA